MMLPVLCIFVFSWVQEVPYKPSEEFEIKFDLSFKQRPAPSGSTFNYSETRAEYEKRTSTTPIPYLVLKVVLSRINQNEDRLKIYRDHENLVMSRRKLNSGEEFELEIGYLDDVKDRVKGYIHVITFYNEKKKEVSRIVIEFDKDGNYLVNGVRMGKV
jgi:hypothetical protein